MTNALVTLIRRFVAATVSLRTVATLLRAFGLDDFVERQKYHRATFAVQKMGTVVKGLQLKTDGPTTGGISYSDRNYSLRRELSGAISENGFAAIPSIPRSYIDYEDRLNLQLRSGFSDLQLGGLALQVVVDVLKPKTALDIGSGEGAHARLLNEAGTKVTAVDYGRSIYYERREHYDVHIGDFMDVQLPEKYELVWMSHVLEHQPNVNTFLSKAKSLVKEGGWIVISVPPLSTGVVGGHLTLWTPGLLLYNMVMSGIDCRNAKVIRCGYNISVFCQFHKEIDLPELSFDSGDINELSAYFPEGLAEGFDGEMYDRLWTPPGY